MRIAIRFHKHDAIGVRQHGLLATTLLNKLMELVQQLNLDHPGNSGLNKESTRTCVFPLLEKMKASHLTQILFYRCQSL